MREFAERFARLEGIILDHPPKQTIQAVLQDCWVLLAYSSSATIDALIEGVPCITLDPANLAWPVSDHDVGDDRAAHAVPARAMALRPGVCAMVAGRDADWPRLASSPASRRKSTGGAPQSGISPDRCLRSANRHILCAQIDDVRPRANGPCIQAIGTSSSWRYEHDISVAVGPSVVLRTGADRSAVLSRLPAGSGGRNQPSIRREAARWG